MSGESAAPAPLLELDRVTRVFRRGGPLSRARVTAVDEVTLRVPDAPTIFAIVGESGSGKTTIARMVLRLVAPTAGAIRLAGRPLHGERAARLDDLAFRRMVQPIFQNPFEAFSIHLPVEFYLRRAALNLGVAADEAGAARAVDAALASVGLDLGRVRGKFAHQFSGGELQRISVARALIPKPRLIVADEPVSMVDASLRMTIINLFAEIRRGLGISFVYITHDLSTAYYVADRIAIMHRGRIVESGEPRAILERPADDYTRLLIDSIPRIGQRWPELERPADGAGGTASATPT